MRLLRIIFCAALLLAASAAIPQTKQGDVTADIPFAFVVARQTLPAGHYVISPTSTDSLGIHDGNNRGTFVPTQSTERSIHDNTCKLVFRRYGDTYFLSEVWASGNTIGKALFRSHAERELEASGKEKEVAVVRLGK
ncbi:MAG TPA: hypothetical protein VKR60_08575 [Candidatus Sulfotelmatobacter sp.]|nr:hypothetical protein [Candidatus Sulfotelmatobacter sp.]